MFAKYEYNAGASQANIVADLVAILCGETNPANLSSDCNTAASEITATVAAGWTIHDAAAGTHSQVIKAPLIDDAATATEWTIDFSSGRLESINLPIPSTYDGESRTFTTFVPYSPNNADMFGSPINLLPAAPAIPTQQEYIDSINNSVGWHRDGGSGLANDYHPDWPRHIYAKAGATANEIILFSNAEDFTLLHAGRNGGLATPTDYPINKLSTFTGANAAKYLALTATSATELHCYAYETWDAVTHTGSNKTENTASQPLDLTNGGRVYVAANVRFVLLGSNPTGGVCLLAEYSRLQPWNTVAAGYPIFSLSETEGLLGGFNKAFLPRVKNAAGTDLIGTSAKCYWATIGTTFSNAVEFPSGASAKVPNESGTLEVPFLPIYLVDAVEFVAPLGDLSSLCDVWLLPKNTIGNLSVITKGADEYIAINASSSNHALVVRKG